MIITILNEKTKDFTIPLD